MGASESAPSLSVFTHESIYGHSTSQQTRQIMNDILQYMLNRLTIHDLTAMSDPTHCRNYIAFKADHLYRFFHHLQITPVRDERDRIFFQSVKTLSEPPIREEQNQLCFTIAYFYTRIFQIYGALALTLHDDINYMRDSGILPSTVAPLGQFGSQFHTSGGSKNDISSDAKSSDAKSSDAMNGGAITEDIGNFNFLREFLDTKTQQGYKSYYTARGLVFFNFIQNQVGAGVQDGHFLIELIGFRHASNIKFHIRSSRPVGTQGRYTMIYSHVSYVLARESTERRLDIPAGILPTVTQIVFNEIAPGQYQSGDLHASERLPARDYLINVFDRLMPYIQTQIDQVYDTMRHGHQYVQTNTRPGTTAPVGRGSEAALRLLAQVRINDKMQIRNIISNLVEQRPLAHCVARAMQLLKMLPSGAVSHICKASFKSAPGERTKMGTPEPRSTLDRNIGIASLSQLFYDTITGATPSLEIGTTAAGNNRSSRDQYISLMRRLSTLFEGASAATAKTDDQLVTGGPAGITNRRDVELCRGINENLSLSTQTNIVALINRYVTALYQFQFDHSAECGRVINELFEIQTDSVSGQNSVRIHPKLFDVGMAELERINGRARTVLTRYYSFCEFIYTFTMQLILRLKNGPPSTPPSTAPLGQNAIPRAVTAIPRAVTAIPIAVTAIPRTAPNPAFPIPPPGGFPPAPASAPVPAPAPVPIKLSTNQLEYGNGPSGQFALQQNAARKQVLGQHANPLSKQAMTYALSKKQTETPTLSNASSQPSVGSILLPNPVEKPIASAKPLAKVATTATTASGIKKPITSNTPTVGFTPVPRTSIPEGSKYANAPPKSTVRFSDSAPNLAPKPAPKLAQKPVLKSALKKK